MYDIEFDQRIICGRGHADGFRFSCKGYQIPRFGSDFAYCVSI